MALFDSAIFDPAIFDTGTDLTELKRNRRRRSDPNRDYQFTAITGKLRTR